MSFSRCRDKPIHSNHGILHDTKEEMSSPTIQRSRGNLNADHSLKAVWEGCVDVRCYLHDILEELKLWRHSKDQLLPGREWGGKNRWNTGTFILSASIMMDIYHTFLKTWGMFTRKSELCGRVWTLAVTQCVSIGSSPVTGIPPRYRILMGRWWVEDWLGTISTLGTLDLPLNFAMNLKLLLKK